MKKTITLILLLFLFPIFLNAQDNVPVKRMRPALLVIDIQNAFLPMMDQANKNMSMQMINLMIDLFRKNGFPIIRIYHTSAEFGVAPDTEPFEFPASVNIKKEDARVIKTYPDAFNKTDLDKTLKEKGVNTVFLCGLSAVGCVLATYIGAGNHDYEAFFIKDALISHKAAYTGSIEEIFGAINYDVVKVMLQNAEK